MFNGMVKSFKTYMTNHFFDRDVIDEVIKKATESYDEMINNLKESYSNDILGGVLKAKTQLISCFVSINTVIAKLAGTMRLNEFMGNYTFTFKNASDGEANRLNKLVSSQKLVVDSVISTDTMNTMFDCYNKETRQSAQFSEDMIPGYKLAPVFKGVEANAEKNEYSAKID
ncbi:MAG: hypothetical protein MJ200_04055 [Mycoplasmoidaceae bacterium]|nr:hypothetical protein [Mycoplasmoidaceae bacterium]